MNSFNDKFLDDFETLNKRKDEYKAKYVITSLANVTNVKHVGKIRPFWLLILISKKPKKINKYRIMYLIEYKTLFNYLCEKVER